MLLTCSPHWQVRFLGVFYIILGMKNAIPFSHYYWQVDLTSGEQTFLPAHPTGNYNILKVLNAVS